MNRAIWESGLIQNTLLGIYNLQDLRQPRLLYKKPLVNIGPVVLRIVGYNSFTKKLHDLGIHNNSLIDYNFLLQIKYINSLSCGGFYQLYLRYLKWPSCRNGVIDFARLRQKECVQTFVKIYLSVRSLTRSHTHTETNILFAKRISFAYPISRSGASSNRDCIRVDSKWVGMPFSIPVVNEPIQPPLVIALLNQCSSLTQRVC